MGGEETPLFPFAILLYPSGKERVNVAGVVRTLAKISICQRLPLWKINNDAADLMNFAWGIGEMLTPV